MNSNKKLALAAFAALGVASGAVLAEPNPYYIGIAQAFTHETNLFRVPRGQPETSDTYSTTSLLAGLDQPIGRQRLFADLAARYNRYRDQDQLNHTGYSALVGTDWEALDKLSGRISYNINDALTSFGSDQAVRLTKKNIEKSQEFVARAQYGSASLLSIDGGYTYRKLDYTAPEYAAQEYAQNAVNLGMLYRPGGSLTLGVAGRHTRGKYPFAVQPSPGVFQQDDFKRDDVDLTAVWVATGLSTVSARLSHTKVTHETVASRDVTGTTGSIRWNYKPTAKLTFDTEYIRDTGAESSFNFISLANGNSIGNDSQLSNTVVFRALYDATAKIQADLSARYVERDLVNTVALSSGASSTQAGRDRLGVFRLGLNYTPTRSLLFGCSYQYEKRGSTSVVSYPYTARVVGCFGQFKLQ
ncbi:MAG: hypothetical protein HS128_09805 [Ideonella sp.]|nr:hypothetical protein [Ideonella sp.]MCC7455545.1 hypothetical protein [Nitrospira sp.]